jgi:antitoxin component YwqK of YwqJK toxin-antitoxin module
MKIEKVNEKYRKYTIVNGISHGRDIDYWDNGNVNWVDYEKWDKLVGLSSTFTGDGKPERIEYYI